MTATDTRYNAWRKTSDSQNELREAAGLPRTRWTQVGMGLTEAMKEDYEKDGGYLCLPVGERPETHAAARESIIDRCMTMRAERAERETNPTNGGRW